MKEIYGVFEQREGGPHIKANIRGELGRKLHQ